MGCRRLIFGTALLICILAAFIFARGVVTAARAAMLSSSGKLAPGQVVDRKISGAGIHKSVYPVIEFTSADGRQHRYTSPIAGSGVPTQIGEAVEVRYDPSAPDRAAINTFGNLYMPAIIPMVIAIFPLGALGAIFVWMTRFGASSDDVRTDRKWVPSWFPP
jgi:uncharacterized protein DUF3592